jgi:hypothetical protein
MADAAERYPQWRERFDENRDQVEREIEQWYREHADLAGHAPLGTTTATGDAGGFAQVSPRQGNTPGRNDADWLDVVGGKVESFFGHMKERLSGILPRDGDDDAQRQALDAGFKDEAYVRECVGDVCDTLHRQGRLTGTAGSTDTAPDGPNAATQGLDEAG